MLLPITAEVLVEEAERLGEGGHRYTSRQLYYAVSAWGRGAAGTLDHRRPDWARVDPGPARRGAALVHSIPISPFLAALGVAALIAAPINARMERGRERRRTLGSRPLAASYDEFLTGALAGALRSRPDAFGGLVATGRDPGHADPRAGSPSRGPPAPRSSGHPERYPQSGRPGAPGPVVVCDRAETAELFAANAGRLPEGTEVTELGALLGDDGGELAPEIRGRVLVASP